MVDRRTFSPGFVVALLAVAALVAALAFMTIGARGNWGFVLPFRGAKLAGMVAVAAAIAIGTVLFQTVAQNRILTPAIMGFDALYVTIQTGLVFILGSSAVTALDPRLKFAVQAGIMIAAALGLFRWLFADNRYGIHLVLLAGIVFGVFCRSLSHFLQRILDPNEFAVLQDAFFARFNVIDGTLLPFAAIAIGAAVILAWRLGPALDVAALGRDHAINLGVDYRHLVFVVLVVVAVLVSISTALVGPVLFLGLLVSNLARHLTGSEAHRHVLPAAALTATIALVGGQTILERGLGLTTALSIVVEFVGGLTFLFLLIRGARR